MDNKELLEEIRILRKEISLFKTEVKQDIIEVKTEMATATSVLSSDFSLFKGKAFGFMAVISVVLNTLVRFLTEGK
jgi:hypothetical protein